MKGARDREELERLRDAVSERLGFAFQADQLEQLGQTLQPRVRELGLEGLDAYVARLSSREHGASETAALAALVTVTETFFFRGQEQVHALLEQVVPLRATGARRLRVVCAGCASGEEPYSIAIALAEMLPDLDAWDVKLFGLDVTRAMLEKAARGRYGAWSLRAAPERLKARYFEEQGREFVLSPRIRRLVEFREVNLVEPNPLFFRSLAADAVFCRNVLMYLTPEATREVVRELTAALLPDGFLFLGHAETLRGLSHDYHL
ncbi:MAG TPA: protein-glutamate O-methyltransferase CheR, partial [Polyangiaceae bacterium]|nr:protein-glutamate O-methyltransferase CheR [Polyangiaceae bacterium]